MKPIILILAIIISQSCSVFNKEERILASHRKGNGEKINIYYVGLGATTNDVIQIRMSKQSEILWASEKYNCLMSSALITDTTLRLVLTDTGFHNYNNKLDTILVNVK